MLKSVNVLYIGFLVLKYQRIYQDYYHALMKIDLKMEIGSVFFKNNYLVTLNLNIPADMQ